MIKGKLAGVEIGADFTFFAVIAMFLTLDVTGFSILSLAACIIHEAGHLTVMLITNRKPNSIIFCGGGIKISNTKKNDIAIIVAGSTVNIIIFFALYFTLPKTDIYPIMFAILNLVIGVFNLLPIGCLDGHFLLEMLGVPKKALRVIEIIALTVVTITIAAALMRGGVNFTLAAAMIYIISVDIFSRV